MKEMNPSEIGILTVFLTLQVRWEDQFQFSGGTSPLVEMVIKPIA